MTKAETVDDVALRIPAHANVLVSISRYDVFLVGCQDERSDDRGMAQDELTSGRVVVRCNRLPFAGVWW